MVAVSVAASWLLPILLPPVDCCQFCHCRLNVAALTNVAVFVAAGWLLLFLLQTVDCCPLPCPIAGAVALPPPLASGCAGWHPNAIAGGSSMPPTGCLLFLNFIHQCCCFCCRRLIVIVFVAEVDCCHFALPHCWSSGLATSPHIWMHRVASGCNCRWWKHAAHRLFFIFKFYSPMLLFLLPLVDCYCFCCRGWLLPLCLAQWLKQWHCHLPLHPDVQGGIQKQGQVVAAFIGWLFLLVQNTSVHVGNTIAIIDWAESTMQSKNARVRSSQWVDLCVYHWVNNEVRIQSRIDLVTL